MQYAIIAQYISSKAGITGLIVTCDVDEYNVDTSDVSIGFITDSPMQETRNGQYVLFFTGNENMLYVATAKTDDSSVDQQYLPALVVRIERVNTLAEPDDITQKLVDYDVSTVSDVHAQSIKALEDYPVPTITDVYDQDMLALTDYTAATKQDIDDAIDGLAGESEIVIVSTVKGSHIGPLFTYATWEFTLTDSKLMLTDWVGAGKDIVFSFRANKYQQDDDAVMTVCNTAGLIRIDGAEPIASTNGIFIVNGNTSFSVIVYMPETGIKPKGNIIWSLKGIDTGMTPDTGTFLAEGTAQIDAGPIQKTETC